MHGEEKEVNCSGIMRVIFVTDQPIPYGLAATNRILSLAKGVHFHGHDVEILVLNPTERKDRFQNTKVKGDFFDVKYQYLTKSTKVPSSFIQKFLMFLSGLINLLPVLFRINREKRINAIIFMHSYSFYPLLVYPFTRFNRIVFLQERNEFPFLFRRKSLFKTIDYIIYTRLVLNLFDGMLLITNVLVNHFRHLTRKAAQLQLLPMTVEFERFEIMKDSEFYENGLNGIVYAGHLWGDKDGVPDLLKSFSLICTNYPQYKLYLIGDNSNKHEYNKLFDLVNNLKLNDRVVFTGRIERDYIPQYLVNAKLLILARPDNVQAKGGFPTKLGEYLATGVPVVVTKVGEIQDYLEDGVSAYLAEPGNPISIASKIDEALSNYPKAIEIGKAGRKIALKYFNYQIQGDIIIQLIKSIKQELSNA